MAVQPPVSKAELSDLYEKRDLSTYKIAKIIKRNPKTIHYWLKKYDISTRPRKVIPISKDDLVRLYETKLSLKEIGKIYGCEATAIYSKFRKYEIKTRTPWETNTIHIKNSFFNNPKEKAYLIGFRIGDLNVTQKTPQSSIIIKSNTTKKHQVDLMKNLFSKYGPIWISKSPSRPNVYHFTASVNSSFSFLIPKHKSVPRWILKSKTLFLSFIAGYSDAEGSAGVYNGRGIFRVGSYDRVILDQIHDFLTQIKIKNSISLEIRVGVHGKRKYNGDFYRICVRDKHAVYIFLSTLLPYLKHEDRIRCVKKVLENVHSRM